MEEGKQGLFATFCAFLEMVDSPKNERGKRRKNSALYKEYK